MNVNEIYRGQLCKITHNYPDKTKTGLLVKVYDIAEPNCVATSPITGDFYYYSKTKAAALVIGEGLIYSNREVGWDFIEPQYLSAVLESVNSFELLKRKVTNTFNKFIQPCGVVGLVKV